jgi:hypothetical protein
MEHSPQASAKKLIPTKQPIASLVNYSSNAKRKLMRFA